MILETQSSNYDKLISWSKCRTYTELPIQIWRLKKAAIKKNISAEKLLESSYLIVKIPNAACYVNW